MGDSKPQSESPTDPPVGIEISPDRLAVVLTVRAGATLKALDAPAILTRLTELGIKLPADGEAEVHEFCRPRKGPRPPVTIARGTPAVDDTPPTLELISLDSVTPLDAVIPREVQPNEPVARIVPGITGHDGIDVFGQPIPHKSAPPFPPHGENLMLASDGSTFLAAVAGILRVRRDGAARLVGIVTALRHDGDVTSDMGSLEYPGDIVIGGNICAGAIVRAGGCVQVRGDVEADELLAGGDLFITGSINARDGSHYTVAGEITAHAILGAKVDAGGDIIVATSIQHSRITCRGKLKIENGEIINSHVTAGGGLACQSIGSAAFSKALIEVGIDDRLRRLAHAGVSEISAHREKARRIRMAIEPLTRGGTSLNAAQKGRVSALLLQADHLEQTAERMTADLRADYEQASVRFADEVTIAATAFPGVTLRFQSVETTLRLPIKGPCRIAAQRVDGSMRIQLFEAGKTTPIPLELRQFTDDWLSTIRQAAA